MSEIEEMFFGEIISGDTGMTVSYKLVPTEKVVLEGQEPVKKDVVILDYDYYNAFIASGGSVTIDENGMIEISNDNFISEDKWTLEYFYNCFKDSETGELISGTVAGTATRAQMASILQRFCEKNHL